MSDLPKIDKCPHCGAERRIPLYVYAHWDDDFTAVCENEVCKKKYSFYKGATKKLPKKAGKA